MIYAFIVLILLAVGFVLYHRRHRPEPVALGKVAEEGGLLEICSFHQWTLLLASKDMAYKIDTYYQRDYPSTAAIDGYFLGDDLVEYCEVYFYVLVEKTIHPVRSLEGFLLGKLVLEGERKPFPLEACHTCQWSDQHVDIENHHL